MRDWLRQHGIALAGALRQLREAPAGFLLNAVAIAIALMPPFAGLTALENLRPLSTRLAVRPEVSVFLSLDAPRERARALASDIRRIAADVDPGVRLTFVPREDALARLKGRGALSDAADALEDNPLPDAYLVSWPALKNLAGATRVETAVDRLSRLPDVDTVQADSSWIRRLAALTRILYLAWALLAATMAVAVLAVAFNTIRLQVLTQREPLSVARLVGATDAFLRRPFLYAGAFLGLCAGALALLAVDLSLPLLNGPVAEFAGLYGSTFGFAPLPALPSAGLLAGSSLLGLAGAMLSLRRHLARLK
ncbi:MAG: cell division protein FtsX [Burkholderiaceae bacterium]